MVKDTLLITNPTGLHTRPAKRVVKEAKNFECTITIRGNSKEGSLKSLVKLMKLGLSQNTEIELICEGSDEQQALDHLKNFITNLED